MLWNLWQELLTIDRGLEHWQYILLGEEVIIYTDHKNLEYYQHPHKVNDWVKRIEERMSKYNYELKHLPGIKNRADALSRRTDFELVEYGEETILPNKVFIKTTSALDIDKIIAAAQGKYASEITHLQQTEDLILKNNLYWKGTRLVVVGNNNVKKGVISLYHDFQTAGHPGQWWTFSLLLKDYWWPNMKTDVKDYIRGCATYQSTKPRTIQAKPALDPITNNPHALPFEVIAMDFIMKLPLSEGYDSILTITDHDCSKAAIFIPCKETIDAEGMATLYAQHVFPHFGIPTKIISNRDIRFTVKFTRELCKSLGVHQNISTAYHPRTDGASERTNQWLEHYLHIYGNAQKNNWSKYLPLAQFVHNSWPNQMTRKTPFELIMGDNPKAHQPKWTPEMPGLEDQKEKLLKIRI
jgi:hypothetical protein